MKIKILLLTAVLALTAMLSACNEKGEAPPKQNGIIIEKDETGGYTEELRKRAEEAVFKLLSGYFKKTVTDTLPQATLEKIKADPATPAISLNKWEPYRNPETLHWIEKSIPVDPGNDDNISTIYRHVYNAIRKGIPYRVKTEEAVEVVRITEIIRSQNPSFRLPKLSKMGPE